MKRYSELNTVELVEANLEGRHGDMEIDPETRRRNLLVLLPMLQRELREYEPTYEQAQGDRTPEVRDWVKWVDHLNDLVIRAEKAAGVCGPDGVPMSIVNNCEAGRALREWRGQDGKVDPEGYMRLLASHGIAGDVTVNDIKQWCRVRFGDDFECALCRGDGMVDGLRCHNCGGKGRF